MQTPTLAPLANGQQLSSQVAAINSNFQIVANALTNTLDRLGTSPDQMQSNLDMNSFQIINLPSPATINSPARVVDVVSNPTIVIPPTGTSGHVVPFLDGNNTWSGTNTFTIVKASGTGHTFGTLTPTTGAALTIKGTGTTNTTFSISCQNSTGTVVFNVQDDGFINSTNLVATNIVSGLGLIARGDVGGTVSTNTLTNAASTTISTGVGSIKMSSANPGTNTGWLKCYIGTQVAWIPCWTTNAP